MHVLFFPDTHIHTYAHTTKTKRDTHHLQKSPMVDEWMEIAFPRYLFSRPVPRTTLAPYTAGEKTPNLACFPMWRLEIPVRMGDDDALVVRRWETTKEDPVWESVIVKALAADKTRAKRRKMVWYVFIMVNYCVMSLVVV